MLRIVVPEAEYFDEINEVFIRTKEQVLHLEHSLVSMSKWESKWNIPFLETDGRTTEQTIDYIRCMTITQNVDPLTYLSLTNEQIEQIAGYIDAPMTATVFAKGNNQSTNREIMTSEVIYYYLTVLNIPFECQKWHLNRLLTLIRVCSIKNAPKKKMSRGEILRQNRELNEARRAKLNTKG